MAPSALEGRRSPAERLLAWLFTGPLGHLYGTLMDLAGLWISYGARRARPG
jgi:hypothetical protein